jgi:hypothetical protein
MEEKMKNKKINLASVLEAPERPKRKSLLLSYLLGLRLSFPKIMKEPEMTFERWESLERKYSPHSSHHAQIYYRDGDVPNV